MLSLKRINNKSAKIGSPILMLHGLHDSSDCFVTNYPEKAPAIVLANEGYDIWLGDSRGNDHSNTHMWLDSI